MPVYLDKPTPPYQGTDDQARADFETLRQHVLKLSDLACAPWPHVFPAPQDESDEARRLVRAYRDYRHGQQRLTEEALFNLGTLALYIGGPSEQDQKRTAARFRNALERLQAHVENA